MASDREDLVQPTRVRLYHRNDTRQNQPIKWETPTDTDFALKAILARTNSNRHEIQVWHGPEMDLSSPRNGSGIDRGFPRRSGSELVVAFDLKAIKSCVIKGKVWIEITDLSGLHHALEFTEDDPNFLTFHQKLLTLLKLLDVKCKMNNSFDRAKWLEITFPPRALPPIPIEPPYNDAAGEDVDYQSVNTRCKCENITTHWPKMPPPPPPSKSPLWKACPVPLGTNRKVSGRSSVDSNDAESISNFTNIMLSSNGGTLDPSTTPEDNPYLIPVDTGAQYVNDRQRNRSTSSAKIKSPSPQVTCRSSRVTSGFDWSCSECTFLNPSTNSRCKMCENPRRADAVLSSDCKECHRLGHGVPPGCKECSIEADIKSKSLNCEECLRVGNSTPPECIECGSATAPKSKEPQRIANPPLRTIPSPVSSPSNRSSGVIVDRWRCICCTLLNPENIFFCKGCGMTRDDAWQCHVCDTVISLDLVRCQRCDVWRCRLCTNQNDARQNMSKFCQACSQPQ